MKNLPIKKYLQTISYAFQNRLAGESIYPFYASYKVTHRCSLQCEFCNVWMEDTPDLPKEDVFKVIDNIANSSIIVFAHLPRFPTRPVRPILCTYSSMSLGRSKLITCFTLGISNPLAAT